MLDLKQIIESYKSGDIRQGFDEKNAGGFWDYAGEIALDFALAQKDDKSNEPVYADEYLQEQIDKSVLKILQLKKELQNK